MPRDQPEPWSFSLTTKEAEKRDPGNEVASVYFNSNLKEQELDCLRKNKVSKNEMKYMKTCNYNYDAKFRIKIETTYKKYSSQQSHEFI